MPRQTEEQRHRGEAGFTLIELLVGLALLGMLSMLLYAGLRDGSRAWQTVETRSIDLERVALTQAFLRERIATLGPAPAEPEIPASGPVWFDGAEDRLSITSPWLERLPVAGLYRFEFRGRRDPQQGGILDVHWRPAWVVLESEPAAMAEQATGQRPILQHIGSFRFAYFGAVEPDGPKAWHPQWRSNSRPPEIVRIEVEFPDSKRIWPSLTVAIP